MKVKLNVKIGQHMLSIALLLVLFISGLATTKAYAADCLTYNTLDDIKEDLKVFKTISEGSISAIKVDGVWFYQFTKSGYSTVRIKSSAFSTSPNNFYLDTDNDALTMKSNHNSNRICYYDDMKCQSNVNYDTYTTSIYRFDLVVNGLTDDEITLQATLTHHVSFTYNTKVTRVPSDFEAGIPSADSTDFYVTPSTRMQYEAALQRTSTVKDITPIMTLEVTNTGDNAVCLSTYTLCGKGKSSESLNVNDYINVATAIGTLITSAESPTINTLVALVDIIGSIKTTFTTKSGEFNTGKSTALSTAESNPTLKVQYKSPVILTNIGDWVQVTTKLSSSKFSADPNGTNTQFKVTFSFQR